MLDVNHIKTILRSNQVMVENVKVVHRDFDFYDGANFVLVGVRRAGKSFLLFQQMQHLLRIGKTWRDMLYINFEDDRLLGFETSDFERLLEAHNSMSGSDEHPILFLDEIQNIDGWHKFARRLADHKYQVYITGSNAKMLGSDVPTTLGGRYVVKTIFPYSYHEFLNANGVNLSDNQIRLTTEKAKLNWCLEEYMCYGGVPECATYPAKTEYLMSVYQKIYLGDIASRHKIENTFALRLMFKKLAESIKQPISFSRLTSLISSTGTKFSKSTAINYMEYSKDSFLVMPIQNMADNFTERKTNMKYYFVDNGIISLLTLDNRTSLLENMVATALWRKYEAFENTVFFYNHNIEVDFVVPEHGLAIQVCYDLGEEGSETYIRETQALLKISKKFSAYERLIILTYSGKEYKIKTDDKTIDVVNVGNWLLSND